MAVVALVVAVLVLARCSGDIAGLGRTGGTVLGNEPFRNGSFLISVTGFGYGLPEIVPGPVAKSHGTSAFKPKNGKFLMVYARATNVSFTSAIMASTGVTLVDGEGNRYVAGGPYVGGADQGFDQSQLPGTTHWGWFAFDVPESVTSIKAVSVQSDPRFDKANPPTLVREE